MAIALVSALAIAEVFTARVIVFFVLIAEALEGVTVRRAPRNSGFAESAAAAAGRPGAGGRCGRPPPG
jgi:hypothetical protein